MKNIDDFLKEVKVGSVTGHFDLRKDLDGLMGRNFENIIFHHCVFEGGQFVRTTFKNCLFGTVKFKKSALIGISFKDCKMRKTSFQDVQASFSID